MASAGQWLSDRSKALLGPALICLLLILGISELLPAVERALTQSDSDLGRQWITSQYVRERVNPYPIALSALKAKFGELAPQGPAHLKDTRIYAIPTSGPDPLTDSALGPPEATYPPTTAIVFGALLGQSDLLVARRIWLAANLIFLCLVIWELCRLIENGNAPSRVALVAAIVLALPATASCIEREQFSLAVLWALLAALRLEDKVPLLSACLYSLALFKPSIAIPFLLIPLVRRKWSLLAGVAAVQVALLTAASLFLRESATHLVSEWLGVARYFRQGMYTLQDVINLLRLDGSWVDTAAPLLMILASLFFVNRMTRLQAISFVSFVSAVWLYHGNYDFVVLLVPCVLFFLGADLGKSRVVVAGCLLILAFALLPMIYFGESSLARGIRWLGRGAEAVATVAVATARSPRLLPSRRADQNPLQAV